ncbi:hypothetical protein CEE44_01475 [Candidatus Woesearchaeota archaeon B3_Woes]|nr:MAG: hypothetical protein CEE44_01475 [Candidatus Woesearchaeota archaeon B3_Woes]
MNKQAMIQELTDKVNIEFDDTRQPIVTEVVLDRVAAFLFEQIEKVHKAKQRLPNYSFLYDVISAVVGREHFSECIHYMRQTYPDELKEMGFPDMT